MNHLSDLEQAALAITLILVCLFIGGAILLVRDLIKHWGEE
ncbi:hypothetical protein [Gracilimonas sediminicola]|nr:hypothetical protein [Gracilimonas sediminicola]